MADDESPPPGDLTPFPEDVLLHILPRLSSPDLARVARLNSLFHSLAIPFLYKTVTLGGKRKTHSITHTADFLHRHPEVADKTTILRIGPHPRCHAHHEGDKVERDTRTTTHPHYLPRMPNLEFLDVFWKDDGYDPHERGHPCPFLKPEPYFTGPSTPLGTQNHENNVASHPGSRDAPLASYLRHLVDERKLATLVLRTDSPDTRTFPFLGLLLRANLNHIKKFTVVTEFTYWSNNEPTYATYEETLANYDDCPTPIELVLVLKTQWSLNHYLLKGEGDWYDFYPDEPLKDVARWIAVQPTTTSLVLVDHHWAIYRFSGDTPAESEQYFRGMVASEMSHWGMTEEEIHKRQEAIRFVSLPEYCEEVGSEVDLSGELAERWG